MLKNYYIYYNNNNNKYDTWLNFTSKQYNYTNLKYCLLP